MVLSGSLSRSVPESIYQKFNPLFKLSTLYIYIYQKFRSHVSKQLTFLKLHFLDLKEEASNTIANTVINQSETYN